MNKVQEALKATLKYLTSGHTEYSEYKKVLAIVESALSEIEKCEPVAYGIRLPDGRIDTSDDPFYFKDEIEQRLAGLIEGCTIADLYTSPQPREWVGLSDSEWVNIVNHDHAYESFTKDDAVHHAVKATEAKLKQLNTKG